jgi:hypothetical protein
MVYTNPNDEILRGFNSKLSISLHIYFASQYLVKRKKWIDNDSIALPYNLGCGLASGDWNIVYKIIEEVFNDYDVTIYKL